MISAARILDKLKVHTTDQIKFRREFPADCLEFAVAEYLHRETGPALTSEMLFSCERHGIARPVSHRVDTDHTPRDKGLCKVSIGPTEHAKFKQRAGQRLAVCDAEHPLGAASVVRL